MTTKRVTFEAGMASSSLIRNNANKNTLLASASAHSLKYIPYESITINELNKDFNQNDAEILMYSIKANGLYHPLAVIYDGDNDKYKLISGEQRYHAIGMMDEEERQKIFPAGIPANVLRESKNELDEHIRIIEANIVGRNYTPEDKGKYIRTLLELYQQKQKMGEVDNAVKKIVELFSLSERQVRKYAAANRMIPELKEALDNGKINFTESEKFAAFSEEMQQQIAKIIQERGQVEKEELIALKKVEESNKELEKKVALAAKRLEEKDAKIEALKNMLHQESTKKESSQEPLEEQLKDEVEKLKSMLAKADADKKRAQTNLENLQLEMKEKNERGITVSKEELKKAADIAKAENIHASIYTLLKEAEKLSNIIKKDITLKGQYSVLAERFSIIVSDEND